MATTKRTIDFRDIGWCLGDAENALRTLKKHRSILDTGDWYDWITNYFLPREIERLK